MTPIKKGGGIPPTTTTPHQRTRAPPPPTPHVDVLEWRLPLIPAGFTQEGQVIRVKRGVVYTHQPPGPGIQSSPPPGSRERAASPESSGGGSGPWSSPRALKHWAGGWMNGSMDRSSGGEEEEEEGAGNALQEAKVMPDYDPGVVGGGGRALLPSGSMGREGWRSEQVQRISSSLTSQPAIPLMMMKGMVVSLSLSLPPSSNLISFPGSALVNFSSCQSPPCPAPLLLLLLARLSFWTPI